MLFILDHFKIKFRMASINQPLKQCSIQTLLIKHFRAAYAIVHLA